MASQPSTLNGPSKNGNRAPSISETYGDTHFTPVFKPHQLKRLKDPNVTVSEKVLEYLRLHHWGNLSTYPCRYRGGLPVTQHDCAEYIGASKQAVSDAYRKLEEDGYGNRENGYFVLFTEPVEKTEVAKKQKATSDRAAIFREYCPEAATELEELRARIKKLRRLELDVSNCAKRNLDDPEKIRAFVSERKAKLKSGASGPESGASGLSFAVSSPSEITPESGASGLPSPVRPDKKSGASGFPQAPIISVLEKIENKEEIRAAAAKVSTEPPPPPDRSKPANTSSAVQVSTAEMTAKEQEVIDACAPVTTRLGLSLTPGMLGLILQNLKNAPASWLAERIKARGKYANSLGILSQLAADAYKQYLKDSANGHKKPASRTVDHLGDHDFVPLWDTNGKGAAS